MENRISDLERNVVQLVSEVIALKKELASFEQTVSEKLPTDGQESSVIANALVTTIKADNIRINSAEIKNFIT